MTGLPPVDLWVGTRDITLPDTRLLRDLLTAAGVEVSYEEKQAAIHVYRCCRCQKDGSPAPR